MNGAPSCQVTPGLSFQVTSIEPSGLSFQSPFWSVGTRLLEADGSFAGTAFIVVPAVSGSTLSLLATGDHRSLERLLDIGRPSRRAGAVLFAAVVGLVMVLRARTHVHVYRRAALVTAGLAAIAACGTDIVVSAPGQANWVCLVATAIGVSMLGRRFTSTGNILRRRALDVLEYVALGAVLPLACWVGGLYGLVRGLSMP